MLKSPSNHEEEFFSWMMPATPRHATATSTADAGSGWRLIWKMLKREQTSGTMRGWFMLKWVMDAMALGFCETQREYEI